MMNNVYARNKKKRNRSSSGDGKNVEWRGATQARAWRPPRETASRHVSPYYWRRRRRLTLRQRRELRNSRSANILESIFASFVKNVTARVTGFLPATITKWFSSPTTATSSGNSNVSNMAGYTTDTSSDDETSDRTSASTHPPVKRMRFSTNISPVPASARLQSQSGSTLDKWSNIPAHSANMVHSTPDPQALRGSIFSSTAIKPTPEVKVDASPSSGDNEFNTTARTSYTLSRTGPSLLQRKRKSLFDSIGVPNTPETGQAKSVSDTSKIERSSTYQEPTFRASLLGSPFYAGRTRYGGASSSYYLNEPNIRQRSVAVVNESKASADPLSGPARRVMDILESYSSPLSEARRMPSYTRTPTIQHTSDYMSPRTSISQLQNIQVPNVGTFLNIKQRSRLMESTSLARQIMASQTSTTDFTPYPQSHKRNRVDNSSSTSTVSSVKSRLKTTSKQSDRWQEELPEPVDLPSVTLNMEQADLPKISFGHTPAPTKTVQPALADSKSTPSSGTLQLNTNMEVTPPDELFINSTFKFSSPIRISNDLNSTITTPPSTAPSFDKVTLLSPLEKTEKISVIKATNKEESKEWRCGDCWVNNKTNVDKCVCCGSKKPSDEAGKKVSKCTKCKTLECEANSAICAACTKIDAFSAVDTPAKKLSPSTWKCDSCWVSNNMSAEKCVCCGDKRVQAAAGESAGDKAEQGGSALSTTSHSVTSVPSFTASNTLPKSDSFKPIIIGSQTNKWECPSCLVKNENIISKCVCCETAKPGTVKESDKKLFNFGVPNTSFKFGIQSQTKEDDKKEENKASENTPKLQINSKETETNNNSLKTAPTFSFGIPSGGGGGSETAAQKDKENKPSPVGTADTLSNKGFALGNTTDFFKIPLTLNTSSTSNSVPNENEDNQKDTQKEQEVPKAFTPIKLGQQTLTPSNFFGSFANKQGSEENKEVLISSAPTGDIVTTSNTTTAESISEPNKPLFTFPTANVEHKKSNRITPVTTATVTHSSPISSPATTATAVFSVGATSTPATTQMFQNPEPTPATTQPSTSAVFSFGSNMPALAANDNNAKFNFSFGTSFAPTFKVNNDTTNSNELVSQQSAPVTTMASGTSLVLNSAPTTNNIFGSPTPAAQSMWATSAPAVAQPLGTNVPNIFSTSTPSNTLSKPAFNFGSTPFNIGNTAPTQIFNNNNQPPAFGTPLTTNNTALTFGAPLTTNNPTPMFGAPLTTNNAAPAFGSPGNTAPTFALSIKPANNLSASFGAPQQAMNSSPFDAQNKSDMFGIQTQQLTNQPSMFMNKEASSSPFGGGAKASVGVGMFGAAPAATAPALNPSAAPNFNFNATPGMFSFNQQQQQQQQQQPQHGVYSFGATQNVTPQVQFNMGSPGNIAPAPNTVVRKVRKAVRRR